MVKTKDKRGIMGIIFFFLILFSILILGFFAVVVVGVLDFSSEIVTPVMEGIGVVGDTNISEASTYTFGVADTFINAVPWLIAFAYVMALIFSIVLVLSYNYNPNPAFIAVYIAFILLLILGSIIISNAYEDIYSGTDEIALKLQSQVAMSYMILYSPMILTAIAFIAGIYLFAVKRNVDGGDYSV
jgi:hypothetical protein